MIEICDFSKSVFFPPPTPRNGALSSAKDLKRPTECLVNGYECFSNILFMTFSLGQLVLVFFFYFLYSDCCLKMLFGDPDFTWIHIYFDLVKAISASVFFCISIYITLLAFT